MKATKAQVKAIKVERKAIQASHPAVAEAQRCSREGAKTPARRAGRQPVPARAGRLAIVLEGTAVASALRRTWPAK